jgi:hypothetical protein
MFNRETTGVNEIYDACQITPEADIKDNSIGISMVPD